jgi:phosphate transport system substrate-binding protein
MSERKESTVLILTLLATLVIVSGGAWWFTERWRNINNATSRTYGKSPVGLPATNATGSCQIRNAPAGLFNYGGSTTWAPIRRETEPVLQNICPEFRLRYTEPINEKPGSGTGIKMAIDNQLAFAQSSRSLKPEEIQQAQAKGFRFQEIPVAIDGIAIAVNLNLDLPGITLAQLKDIYTGKITNWSEVGGPNLKITSYSRPLAVGGTVDFFKENVLNQAEFSSRVQLVDNTTLALRELEVNPGGIYYASAPEILGQCSVKPLPLMNKSNQPISPYKAPDAPLQNCRYPQKHLNAEAFRSGEYPITRRLFVIIKVGDRMEQQAGEAYANWLLSPQGQELIEKAGFVRIK